MAWSGGDVIETAQSKCDLCMLSVCELSVCLVGLCLVCVCD